MSPATDVSQDVPAEYAAFEQLLMAVASELSNVAEGQFDATMTSCLRKLVEFLGFDRSTLMAFQDRGPHLCVTHCWAAEGIPCPAKNTVIDTALPWTAHQICSGHMVHFSTAADLPPEAAEERDYLLDSGLKSSIAIPLTVEGAVLGAVAFGSFRAERHWPHGMVSRLRLVGEVLALGIRRHQYAEGLEEVTKTVQGLSLRRPAQEPARTEQLRRLAIRLMRAESQERRRIGELLHEDVMQVLALIGMSMQSAHKADPIERATAISQTTELLGQAIEKLRKLVLELRPEALSKMGVAEGITWLANHMRQIYGLIVQVHVDSAVEPINEDLRFLLYDGARKLLVNVATHARCKEARLDLERLDSGHVRLMVSDAGDGFDVACLQDIPNRSFGLFSLREQAELLGGRLEVRSERGRGTSAALTVPA